MPCNGSQTSCWTNLVFVKIVNNILQQQVPVMRFERMNNSLVKRLQHGSTIWWQPSNTDMMKELLDFIRDNMRSYQQSRDENEYNQGENSTKILYTSSINNKQYLLVLGPSGRSRWAPPRSRIPIPAPCGWPDRWHRPGHPRHRLTAPPGRRSPRPGHQAAPRAHRSGSSGGTGAVPPPAAARSRRAPRRAGGW